MSVSIKILCLPVWRRNYLETWL